MSIYRMIKALRYYDKSEMYERRLDTSVPKGSADYTAVLIKPLALPWRKEATSMSKYTWMMNPSRSREMPSGSVIDLAEIRRSSTISSWIWSIISGVVGLRTYQHGIAYILESHEGAESNGLSPHHSARPQ
jgi:hypothetical protein